MRRVRIAAAGVVGVVVAMAAMAASSQAAYHLVKVREVHRGSAFTGDYVMLQMYEAGQNIFATHHVRILDATGSAIADYELQNVPNGQTQRTYLLGNTGVAGADQNEAGVAIQADGAVCYNELGGGGLAAVGIDCVSWGSFTPGAGSNALSSPSQPNFASSLGTSQSLVRKIGGGCATALDSADDTNNSALDWVLGDPIGRGNSAIPTENLCTPGAKKKQKKCKKKKKGKKGAAAAKKKKCKKKKKKK